MSQIRAQLSRVSPLSIGVVLLFAAAMTYFLFKVFAASGGATLYTSPSGGQSAYVGQSFVVTVRVSTGASVPVTGASVYLSYPVDKLQVVGESYGGPYNTQLAASNSGGVLRLDRAAFPMVSGGDQLFARVTFKAIATGSASVNFTGSSIVTSGEDDSNILSSKKGVTYNLSTPPSSPSPSGGSSDGGSSGSGSSSGSGGSSGSSGGSAGSSSGTSGGHGPRNDHHRPGGNSSSGSNSSQPGSNSSSGTIVTSDVRITVVDSHGQPVEGAEVTINNQTVKTDKNGVAYFSGVVTGKLTVAVKYNGKKTTKKLDVKGASTESAEFFKVSITRNKFNPVLLLLPIIILVAAATFIFRPWSGRLKLRHAENPTDGDMPIVTSNQPPSTDQSPSPNRKIDAPGTTVSPTAPSSDEKSPPDNK